MNLIDAGNMLVLVEGGLNPDQAKRVSDQWRAQCSENKRLREALADILNDGPIWRAQRIAREALGVAITAGDRDG